jgi:hypothetical protein
MAVTKTSRADRLAPAASQHIVTDTAASTSQEPTAMGRDRRRSPRVELLGLVSGRLLRPGTAVVVRDMSLGGLATETPFPLERGSVHDLQLTLGDGAAVDLRARVMHCRNIAADGEEPKYFTGFQFVDDEGDDAMAGEFLDNVG